MKETIEKSKAMVQHLAAVNEILAKNNHDPARLIAILQEVQEVYKYLSKDVISYVATSLDIPVARVYGVATFYAHFSLKPKGKHIFRLCDGTACHVKKSHSILNMLYKRLNLNDEKRTTDDMMFTIELVSCLGACGLAPVMVVDEAVHGQATPEQASALIDEVMAAEAAQTEKAI
ncbi:MAG: NAD(P)H-dependent oxidoreductase subunit E [Victivallaceae bacterium]|nr:NAD(P)H-dependent oxidoreductase subunit E [Victivallaceae bacterium]MDD3115926.1 NAD(P)H-dependent oxidoreductase subunit E [Victivallaceae bacterium]MDD3703512.1 NAD(P)H-dependent oxidoreductase subunit E [Victivallaceae bacterium]MDD4317127.1 NAD(P)H-dependent oxidoreductase subunit E [Victivallaceae bacterium]MDD5662961.1 NAD(P)H-dependent oxidoreductase subunit E [Victivallaceae bacterium]